MRENYRRELTVLLSNIITEKARKINGFKRYGNLKGHSISNFMLNSSYKNRNFRNCIAHYGLGQYLNETEIVEDDLLKGLTYKAFDLDYFSTKI